MKKAFALVLTFIMIAAMGVTAFAAPNGFIVSPSANKNPTLVDWDPISPDCNAGLTVTPFGDRDKLDDESREQLEAARDSIVNASDLTELNEDLKKKSQNAGIDADDLAVSDLFDVDYTDCDIHDEHKGFKVWLDSDQLDKFVGLMHFDGENWTLIDDAEIDEDGYLVFSSDKTGPFAIVLNTAENGSGSDTPPQTGDDFHWWIYVALMAVSAVALVIIGLKLKKAKEQ